MFNHKDSDKLGKFISNLKNNGFARTNRYSVLIPLPRCLLNKNYSSSEMNTLLMMCDSVQLPGMSYSTNPNRTYGESREVPYERLFDNITLTFYVGADLKEKKFFDDWQRNIMNPVDRTFNYYDQYITNVNIHVEDLEDNEVYKINLHECYPKSIGAIQMDYAAKDIMKLTVTLTYKYWDHVFSTEEDRNYYSTIKPEIKNTITGITDTRLA